MSDKYSSFQKFIEAQRPSENVVVQPEIDARKAQEAWAYLDHKRMNAGLPPMDPRKLWNFPNDVLLRFGLNPRNN